MRAAHVHSPTLTHIDTVPHFPLRQEEFLKLTGAAAVAAGGGGGEGEQPTDPAAAAGAPSGPAAPGAGAAAAAPPAAAPGGGQGGPEPAAATAAAAPPAAASGGGQGGPEPAAAAAPGVAAGGGGGAGLYQARVGRNARGLEKVCSWANCYLSGSDMDLHECRICHMAYTHHLHCTFIEEGLNGVQYFCESCYKESMS